MSSEAKWMLRMANIVGGLLFTLAPLWGIQQNPQPIGGLRTSLPGAAPIKVEVISFSFTPTHPRPGDTVTLRASIKNTGAERVAKVPWAIHLYTENTTLRSGEQLNLDADRSFDATATWTAKAGKFHFQVYVDPTGKTFKNTAPLANQVRELDIEVPAPTIVQLTPNFLMTGIIGAIVQMDQCKVKLQTGDNASYFKASDGLKALGVTDKTFNIPQYKEEREQQVDSKKVYDPVSCGQWLAGDPMHRKNQECPYYSVVAITAKFNLTFDLNDVNTDQNGISATFSGTNLIMAMKFEEQGKELTGSVSKKIIGNADITIPVSGELSNISMSLTFALSVSNSQLDVQFSSFDFASSLTLDVFDQQVPPQLMDRLKIQSQFIDAVKTKGSPAIRDSGIAQGLKSALNNYLKNILQLQTITAVRAGSHGGADVEGYK